MGDRRRYLLQSNPSAINMPTEFSPPQELIESLLVSEVMPKLASFENDGCSKLIAQLVIAVRETTTPVGIYGSTGLIETQANGELRIRIRKTGNANRVVWRIESLFPDAMPCTGFVGFDSEGDAKRLDGQWQIRSNGWNGKYKVRNWRGWT